MLDGVVDCIVVEDTAQAQLGVMVWLCSLSLESSIINQHVRQPSEIIAKWQYAAETSVPKYDGFTVVIKVY